MGERAPSAVRTGLWTLVFAAAVGFVLVTSMRGTAPPAAPTVTPPPSEPAGTEPNADAGAAAWGQFAAGTDVMVRAEDVKELRGLMTLNKGPDNRGVRTASGEAATVQYVWCEDDGAKDEEPDAASVPHAQTEHAAVFAFDVPETGTYYPWVRVWWQDSCGNSLILVVEPGDGSATQCPVGEGPNQWWQWLPITGAEGIQLPKGTCRLIVTNREDGARLSRALFTTRSYATYKPETPEG